MNRKGLTAFMDAMIFFVVIMMAISVTVTSFHFDSDDAPDPDEFLTGLSGVQLRLSDLTEIEDDSLSYISDLMAYSVSHECDVQGYLGIVLDGIFGEHRYRMVYSFGEESVILGDFDGFYRSFSSRAVPVSTGGTIYMELGVL